ncbi:hypothetical protein CY35_05G012100 [Sphagnum magellanicum]|nr:hypothetical protein CY35_05G012100 [Sphagnum magellanicum]
MGMVARAMVASSSSMIGAQEFSSCQQQMRVPFLSSSDAAVRPGPISIKFLGKLPGSKSRAGTAAAPAVFLRVNRVAALAMPKEKWNLRDEAEERWKKVQENPLEGVTFTSEDFEKALAKYDFSCDVGDVVKGVVIKSDMRGALIDIGAKAPAYLPLYEACIHPLKNIEEVGLFPGSKEEYMILREDDDNGRMIVSLRELQKDIAWERCRQLQMDNVTVRAKALTVNRGGVVVNVEGLPGFMPFSQMSKGYVVEELVGKEIPFKILEANEEQMRLILSNKKAVAENQPSYTIGSVVEGTVQSVKPYGAFIDIGTVVGLLHISQISHDRLTSVEAVLAPGDKLKVMILSQDKEKGRISFSTKKLEPTPGDMLRNPALVYAKAEETARMFTHRVPQSAAAIQPQQSMLNAEDWLNLRTEFASSSDILGTGRMS